MKIHSYIMHALLYKSKIQHDYAEPNIALWAFGDKLNYITSDLCSLFVIYLCIKFEI